MKSLGAILQLRDPAELRAIAAVWGIASGAGEEHHDLPRLERLMRDLVAARTAWEGLSTTERVVLQAIVGPSARNWCPVDALATRAAVNADEATHALDSLQAMFIVATEPGKLQGDDLVGQRTAFYGYTTLRSQQSPIVEKTIAYVPTEIATTLYTTGREMNPNFPDRTTLSLDDLLMPYRQGDLDQIGKRFGLSLHTYCSRNEVRTVIADNVSQAEAVQFALEQLDAPLRDLYEWLIARGGRATIDEVRRRMRWDIPELLQALRTFEEFAIAFDAFSERQRVIFIPTRTFDNLRRAHTRPKVEAGLRERATPPTIRPADSTVLWDIAAFVAAVVQQDVELTRSNTLPKRTAQRILPLLTNDLARPGDEGSTRYLAQIQAETLDLGLVQTTTIDDRTRLDSGPKLDIWANQDCRMQTHRILRRWTHNRNWHDRAGARYVAWMASSISATSAREAIVQVLRQCDPGVWYDLPSLLRTIQGEDPFVLRPNQRFNGHGGFKVADEVRAHWDNTDGEILTGILSSTLHDLGIVALGYDTETLAGTRQTVNPDAILLTELGAEVLKGDLGLAQVPTDRPLVVQPNFEILLMEPHMPALYWLVRFAQPEQLGRASRFKLTRDALLRSMNERTTLDDIVEFLAQHSQKELPQNVIYTLRDWSRQYKETRVSSVVLIEVDDEDLATELCESSKLRDLGLRRVGPCALVTPEATARMVRRAIERAGYAALAPEPVAPVALQVRQK